MLRLHPSLADSTPIKLPSLLDMSLSMTYYLCCDADRLKVECRVVLSKRSKKISA